MHLYRLSPDLLQMNCFALKQSIDHLFHPEDQLLMTSVMILLISAD